MPHRVQMQKIKARIKGIEGAQRVRILRGFLDELPRLSGPYAAIRRWVHDEIARSQSRAKRVFRDSIQIAKEGDLQLALVGPPNAGKSSLLRALSGMAVAVGSYAFTTTRPVAALVRDRGALIQVVEIPGLIESARLDAGGGRALLGVLRNADVIAYLHGADASLDDLRTVMAEVAGAGIDRPWLVVLTKSDLPEAAQTRAVLAEFPELVEVSAHAAAGLGALLDRAFALAGLMRAHPCDGGEPIVLPRGATVAEFAHAIHRGLSVREALITGPSARFPGQRVGPKHELCDGDYVDLRMR
jgi:small GTP-binding protein